MSTEVFFLLLMSVCGVLVESEDPCIDTPKGKILGSTLTSRLGKTIYSFRGIRYAKAPVNELRFQPPQPVEAWSDIYNATSDAPSCPQIGFAPNSEDCLYLNVYTTKLPSEKDTAPLRPVIVRIHPGAFISSTGRSNWAGPHYLLDEDILLVTFNYRLGILGFISTGEKEAPGNLGMKDQVQVLKWVRENIQSFGGDPNCVTIFGYSAGSSSVMLHMLSPMSKGLFHRAIAGSASPLRTWPTRTNLLEAVKRQARVVGCPDNTSSTEIVNCLKSVPAEVLGKSARNLAEIDIFPLAVWEPIVEPDFGQERFLSDDPVIQAAKGQYQNVPLMTGVNVEEFSYLARRFLENETLRIALNSDFEKYAPIILKYERDSPKSFTISRELRGYYLGNGEINNSSFKGLGELLNDGITGFGVNRAAKLFSKKNTQPVFYYQFATQGRYSHVYIPGTNNTVPYGVVHHDELIYLFYISTLFPKFTPNDPESRTVDRMTKLWSNFAKTGNPVPKRTPLLDNVTWEPFTSENGKYMIIGDELKMATGLHAERYKLWEQLFPLPAIP